MLSGAIPPAVAGWGRADWPRPSPGGAAPDRLRALPSPRGRAARHAGRAARRGPARPGHAGRPLALAGPVAPDPRVAADRPGLGSNRGAYPGPGRRRSGRVLADRGRGAELLAV